jgi:hypothetical protein
MIKGQLCHIPQDVYLLHEGERKYLKTEKPIKVLIWEHNKLDSSCKIVYKNEVWTVKSTHTYPVEQEC